jgi:hypothetical protein
MKQQTEEGEEIKKIPKLISLNYLERLVIEQEKKDELAKNKKSNIIVGYDTGKPKENIFISPIRKEGRIEEAV